MESNGKWRFVCSMVAGVGQLGDVQGAVPNGECEHWQACQYSHNLGEHEHF